MRTFSIFFAGLFILAVGLTGCAPRWVRTPVVDQKDIQVTLEHQVAKKQPVSQQYQHPLKIDLQHLNFLLTQLKYVDEPMIYGKPEEKPVFQAVEVERLVPALTEALAAADANQRVRFISHNRGGGLLFKKQRTTSGIAFIDADKRLNLAFSDVNFEILTGRAENFSQNEELADPLIIRSSFTPIIPPDYAEHRLTEKGKPYPLWIAIDLDKLAKAAAATPAPAVEPAPVSSPVPAPLPAAASAPKSPMMEQQAPTVSAPTPAPPPDDSWETRKQDQKEKLRYYKELYDDGLIDEQEYKAQKAKILNQP